MSGLKYANGDNEQPCTHDFGGNKIRWFNTFNELKFGELFKTALIIRTIATTSVVLAELRTTCVGDSEHNLQMSGVEELKTFKFKLLKGKCKHTRVRSNTISLSSLTIHQIHVRGDRSNTSHSRHAPSKRGDDVNIDTNGAHLFGYAPT